MKLLYLQFLTTIMESPPQRNLTSIWKAMSASLMSSVVCRFSANLLAVGVGIPVTRIILPGHNPPTRGYASCPYVTACNKYSDMAGLWLHGAEPVTKQKTDSLPTSKIEVNYAATSTVISQNRQRADNYNRACIQVMELPTFFLEIYRVQ